jgi:hypothetical protein
VGDSKHLPNGVNGEPYTILIIKNKFILWHENRS